MDLKKIASSSEVNIFSKMYGVDPGEFLKSLQEYGGEIEGLFDAQTRNVMGIGRDKKAKKNKRGSAKS